MKKLFAVLICIYALSCTNKKEEGIVISDEFLVQLAASNSSFSFFRNRPDTLVTDPSSEHGLFMRVRLNPRAVSDMNDSLSQLNGTAFTDESMIVKEMYDVRGGAMTGFVVMYKLHNAADNSYGWVWGEYKADGNPVYSVSNKGERCLSCHLQPSNSDLVRTFSLH